MKSKWIYYISLTLAIIVPYLLLLLCHENWILPVDIDFIMLGLVLIVVSLFHRYTLITAITGLLSILFYNLLFKNIDLLTHFNKEKLILLNLLGLLLGFALLANHFEQSRIPEWIASKLKLNWKGALLLLLFVFFLSSFLDNIAAALIGGTIAFTAFNRNVHIGYIVAIVAASNAGGAGSIIGDTTTIMMWIEGVPENRLLTAYIAAIPAVVFFSFFASKQQTKSLVITTEQIRYSSVNYKNLLVVFLVLAGAIVTNLLFNLPFLGVWLALIAGSFFAHTHWSVLKEATKGSLFLLSLVTIASLMPVKELPEASKSSSFFLGFLSSVFDNIPLTKIALEQNGYDWGLLAYCVGFGGSMLWFGSSAGVAISNLFPEVKSTVGWLRYGWHIVVAYVIGFVSFLLVTGWRPYTLLK